MGPMDRCPACDAEREANDAPCPFCGAPPAEVPFFELPTLPPPRVVIGPKTAPRDAEAETAIDLAFDPRDREIVPGRAAQATREAMHHGREADGEADLARAEAADHDASDDARLLGDYGGTPKHWLFSPPYAWRVFQRRRAIKRGLALRSKEAARATEKLEDALVALAERIRPVAEQAPSYMEVLDMLSRAERVLRSRDAVLASEHDAQATRLAAIDARLSKLESELAAARADGREAAATLVTLQSTLAREESNLKRAETELRATQVRSPSGNYGSQG
jgi:hypothetical protein